MRRVDLDPRQIRRIEASELDGEDNHLSSTRTRRDRDDHWPHTYPRSLGAYPAPWLRDNKYWPPVGRIDNPYGDRNLVCTCPPMSEQVGV
ncbi:MAG: hypothetical protein R3C45_05615 [Phycisphaerales bacterium]